MIPSTNAPPAYVAGPQHVVAVQPAPVTGVDPRLHNGNWKGMQWTGIIQVVLGSLTVILGIVTAIVFHYYINDIGSPIWGGILAIGYMVMSILACLSAVVVIGFAAVPVAVYSSYYCSLYNPYYGDCRLRAGVIGVYATLILLGIAEFVVAIVGASMTCGPLCNTGRTTPTVIQYQAQPHVVVATQPQGPAFYNVPAGQQLVAYPAQQNVYPQAEAPPTSGQQYQELK